MVVQKIYIRLGKKKNKTFTVDAKLKPNAAPMWSRGDPRTREALPTTQFAIEVDIPDEKFDLESVAVAKINFELEKERLIVKAIDAL